MQYFGIIIGMVQNYPFRHVPYWSNKSMPKIDLAKKGMIYVDSVSEIFFLW